MKILVRLLEPSTGRVYIQTYEVWSQSLAAKATLDYVPDRALLYERLSGCEFLRRCPRSVRHAQHSGRDALVTC